MENDKPPRNESNAGIIYMRCSVQGCGNKYPQPPCDHMLAYMEMGSDHALIGSGVTIGLHATFNSKLYWQELPWLGWTTVDVGTILRGGFREITLVHQRADTTELNMPLGLLGPNEGRYHIALLVMDVILGKLDPKDKFSGGGKLHTQCQSSIHRFQEQKEKIRLEQLDMAHRTYMMYALGLEKACLPCLLVAYGEPVEEEEAVPF